MTPKQYNVTSRTVVFPSGNTYVLTWTISENRGVLSFHDVLVVWVRASAVRPSVRFPKDSLVPDILRALQGHLRDLPTPTLEEVTALSEAIYRFLHEPAYVTTQPEYVGAIPQRVEIPISPLPVPPQPKFVEVPPQMKVPVSVSTSRISGGSSGGSCCRRG